MANHGSNWSYIDKNGREIDSPTTADMMKQNAYVCYRTTSTPCSCPGCSGEHYDRAKEKQEVVKEIGEGKLFYDDELGGYETDWMAA